MVAKLVVLIRALDRIIAFVPAVTTADRAARFGLAIPVLVRLRPSAVRRSLSHRIT
jgi:hypothetical protein